MLLTRTPRDRNVSGNSRGIPQCSSRPKHSWLLARSRSSFCPRSALSPKPKASDPTQAGSDTTNAAQRRDTNGKVDAPVKARVRRLRVPRAPDSPPSEPDCYEDHRAGLRASPTTIFLSPNTDTLLRPTPRRRDERESSGPCRIFHSQDNGTAATDAPNVLHALRGELACTSASGRVLHAVRTRSGSRHSRRRLRRDWAHATFVSAPSTVQSSYTL